VDVVVHTGLLRAAPRGRGIEGICTPAGNAGTAIAGFAGDGVHRVPSNIAAPPRTTVAQTRPSLSSLRPS
jgi:hypothetical protein